MRRQRLAVTRLAVAWPVAPALAGHIGGAPDDHISAWRVIGALLICFLIAIAAAVALKARRERPVSLAWLGRSVARRLALVESLRLSPQLQLCIVECDGREMLFSASPSGAVFLRDLDPRGRANAR